MAATLMERLERRLELIETQLIALVSTVAGMSEHQREMNGDMAAMISELGGLSGPSLPHGESVRGRLRVLEDDRATAKAISSYKTGSWGLGQKIALFGFASSAAIEGLLRLFGIGG